MTSAARKIRLCLILMLALGFARPCMAVNLRSDTEVNRPTVKLSDVFEALPDGADIDIARAPAPDKSITYNVTVLNRLAQQYKLDWRPQSLADHTTITTIATKLTVDDIRPLVIKKINALDIKGDIEVMFDRNAMDIALASDHEPRFALNNFNFDAGTKRFRADLSADGFTGAVNQPVAGRILVRKNIPVLVRRLEAGTIISSNDVDWLSVNEDRTAGMVTSAEQLIDHELRRDMDGDQPVRESLVMQPRLVVRGSIITMKIETPLMTITAQGRALQDGKLGDVVRVTNTQTNRAVEGTVESTGVVRVQIHQKMAAADAVGRQQ